MLFLDNVFILFPKIELAYVSRRVHFRHLVPGLGIHFSSADLSFSASLYPRLLFSSFIHISLNKIRTNRILHMSIGIKMKGWQWMKITQICANKFLQR